MKKTNTANIICLKNIKKDSVIGILRQEATEALVSLGYTVSDAYKVLQKLDINEDTRVEDVIKMALRQISI